MKKILNYLIASFPSVWLIIILMAVAVGLSCPGSLAWFWIIAAYAVGHFLFNVGRQIYWRITKTGDYAYMQKSSKTVSTDTEAGTN